MLYIVGSYHCVQFQGKLKNQTSENGKNLVPGWFWHLWPKFRFFIFFSKLWLRQLLDIMVSYHHVQYQENLMIQSSENLVTDGQTGESDFIGRCRTNFEQPKKKQIMG